MHVLDPAQTLVHYPLLLVLRERRIAEYDALHIATFLQRDYVYILEVLQTRRAD